MLADLYISRDGDHAQAFLFLGDGVVLDVLLRKGRGEDWGDLTQVHDWLRPGVQGVVEGRYTTTANHLRLETVGHFGDGERMTIWEGTVTKNRLVLSFFDHHSSRRGTGVVFERIPKPRRAAR